MPSNMITLSEENDNKDSTREIDKRTLDILVQDRKDKIVEICRKAHNSGEQVDWERVEEEFIALDRLEEYYDGGETDVKLG